MKYFIYIDDNDEEAQINLETFCQDNKIICNADSTDFIGRGFTRQEINNIMNDYFLNKENPDIDKDIIVKFFALDDIATNILAQLNSVLDQQFKYNFLPVADSVMQLKLEDFTTRARNLDNLVHYAKQYNLPRKEFERNYKERAEGVEPIYDIDLFLTSDTTFNVVSSGVVHIISHILTIVNRADLSDTIKYVDVRLSLLSRLERRVSITLTTQDMKEKLLDSALMPIIKGKERYLKDSFAAISSFYSELSSLLSACDKDFSDLKTKSMALISNYAQKYPQNPLFKQSLFVAKDAAEKIDFTK